MKTKKQIQSIIQKSIDASFKDGKLLEKRAQSFIKIFKSQSKVEAIELLTQYLKNLKRVLNSTTMVVESVIPLANSEKADLKKKYATGFTVHNIEYKLDPSLLGGLRVKIGDYISEDSLRSRIAQVKEIIHG